jgi:hypothetical protein
MVGRTRTRRHFRKWLSLLLLCILLALISVITILLHHRDNTSSASLQTTLERCYTNPTSSTHYALNPAAAPASDVRIQGILTAKCELNAITSFASTVWPTYGTHREWQNGDHIYYARPDLLGQLGSATDNKLVLLNPSGTNSPNQSYRTPQGQTLTAYYRGKRVALSSLHSGDAVFSIVRVSETYSSNGPAPNGEAPTVLGAIGVVKLAEPLQYYQGLQNDVVPTSTCQGNPTDTCPEAPNQFDIFPSDASDNNNSFSLPMNGISREIVGTVVQINTDTLTMKGSSGSVYTVSLPTGTIARFNTQIAPQDDPPTPVQVGSSIDVVYTQAQGANPHVISTSQVETLSLNIFTPATK